MFSLKAKELPYTCVDSPSIKFISFYSILMCILAIHFIIYTFGRRNTLLPLNPFFAVICRPHLYMMTIKAVLCICVLITSSALLILALKFKIRICMIPWLLCYGFVTICQFLIGISQIFYYSSEITVRTVNTAIFNLLWLLFNIYCWNVVYLKYRTFGNIHCI